MQKNTVLIGIDPDVEKSGVAIITPEGMDIKTLKFFDVFDYLRGVKNYVVKNQLEIIVFIECGFLNKGNRHFKDGASTAFNGKISERVGENHQAAKKIIEMCRYLCLQHEQVRPVRTKLKADEFKMKTNCVLKTNQEQRDAMMLIWDKQT